MPDGIKELADEIRNQGKSISRMEEKVTATHEWVKSHETRLVAIKEDLDRAKGGWFAMIGFTGLAGAIGAMLTKLIGK